MELKEGWWVPAGVSYIGIIHTPYLRGNGDGITFTYNESAGVASDDGDTDFEVGTLKDGDWINKESVCRILEDNLISLIPVGTDGIMLNKEIKSVDDLYVFGKALREIDQLF